jgi:DnaK suppressor protein
MAHLTQEQLAAFRERLLEAKESIEKLLAGSAGERPIETSGSTIGRLTRMDAMQMQAMAQMSRRQLDVRLQQIAQALAALERGTYGVCRLCKEPIGVTRLEALPEAPFCVFCQEGIE